jgi:hypothetical protein
VGGWHTKGQIGYTVGKNQDTIKFMKSKPLPTILLLLLGILLAVSLAACDVLFNNGSGNATVTPAWPSTGTASSGNPATAYPLVTLIPGTVYPVVTVNPATAYPAGLPGDSVYSPANTAEPAENPNPAGALFYGSWRVAKGVSGPVAALSQEEADSWIGKIVSFDQNEMVFDQVEYAQARYVTEDSTLSAYLADFNTTPEALGYSDGQVILIRVECGDSTSFDFVQVGYQTLIYYSDGYFFFLEQ